MNLIAKRTLLVKKSSQLEENQIVVKLFTPIRSTDSNRSSWSCNYCIEADNLLVDQQAFGWDSFDCLQIAIEFINNEIERYLNINQLSTLPDDDIKYQLISNEIN